ncbi:MAG: MFS transporter [Hyphomicrobiaceae bacterium]
MPLLLTLASACFVAALSIRVFDPIVPEVARSLEVSVEAVALMVSVYAFPYALSQPILGPLGDSFGKARIIKACLGVQLICSVTSIFATSVEQLYVIRFFAGVSGGGIIPLALAMVADRFALHERQVALSRVLTAMLIALLVGATGSGLLASWFGWRAVMVVTALLSGGAFVQTCIGLQPRVLAARDDFRLSAIFKGYSNVFANPRAAYCYGAVCCEGILIFGLLPYIAVLLESRNAGGIREAGLILAAMGIGGLTYTLTVARVLPRLGSMFHLMRIGGIAAAIGFGGVAVQGSWQFDLFAYGFLGLGFYSVHNSLQTQATELAPENRGAAVSLHAFFFFVGHAIGPAFYGLVLAFVGIRPFAVAMVFVVPVLVFALAAALEKLKDPGD